MIIQCPTSIRRITDPSAHHFFGYFDKFPWDKSGRFHLAHRTNFTARQPLAGEKATLGMIDLQDNDRFIELGTTDAWCWQQGCMLQWLNDSDTEIIYNDRENNHFISRILDVKTGKSKTLCRPVYCLSPDGRYALSLNFSRLNRERPGYGYPGAEDSNKDVPTPANEGIWLIDLKANTAKLIISVAQITDLFHRSDMEDVPGWFNHLLFSPDSRRFAFFHRWRIRRPNIPSHLTHMFTADIDGGNIWPLNLEDYSSHYTWISPSSIINYARRFKTGDQYYIFHDRSHRTEIIAGDVFPGDGHCSYSPDRRWMLTDCYPPKTSPFRKLFLYDLIDQKAYELGNFYSDPSYPTPTRCDLHPRWSRDGRSISIDSTHEHSRQVYLLDLSEIIK